MIFLKLFPVCVIDFFSYYSFCIGGLGVCLNSEASKFALAFKPPVLDESQFSCETFLNRLVQLSLICKSVPKRHGKYLHEEILSTCKNVLRASIDLGNNFLEKPIEFEGRSQKFKVNFDFNERDMLTSTGILWKECEALKTLSKDNREATSKRWSEIFSLIDDAIAEIQKIYDTSQTTTDFNTKDSNDNIAEDSDEIDSLFNLAHIHLSPNQAIFVKKALSLMKFIRTVFIKILKRSVAECNVKLEEMPLWLDQLIEQAEKLCDFIDELGASIWDINNREELRNIICQMIPVTIELLNLAISKSDAAHLNWYETCIKQVLSLKTNLLKEIEGW